MSAPARDPVPPPELVDWIERWGGAGVGGDLPRLREGARSALLAALARSGRDRDGAYALLAADALLTYALEDGAATGDPEGEFRDLLRVAGEPGKVDPG
jgi:hypothetical protein